METGQILPLFNYDPPTITSINPSSGVTEGGYSVVIGGTSFGRPATAVTNVTLGGSACVVTTYTDTSITCTVPPGQGASQAVDVITQNQPSTNTFYFTYTTPTINSIVPGCCVDIGAAITLMYGRRAACRVES